MAFGKIVGKGGLNLVDEDCLAGAIEKIAKLSEVEQPRFLTLEGRDERAFIGGADLKVLRSLNPKSAQDFIGHVHQFCKAIRRADFPVIAKLKGYCLGAGMEIAASCDIRVGDYSVKCGMPEVRVGVPSVVEAALLPGLIGWGKAREIMLRGNIFGSEEALSMNFLQSLAKEADLESICKDIEKDILLGGRRAITLQKELFNSWDQMSVEDGVKEGIRVFSESYQSEEPKAMIDRFFSGKA